MKKILLLLCSCLLTLVTLTGCSGSDDDLTEKIKVEVVHDITTEGNKMMDITYPTVGGLESSRALATINSSIENYISIQENEFNNALSSDADSTPINSDFDATATKQITPPEAEEEGVLEDEDGQETQESDNEEDEIQPDGEESGEEANTEGAPITLTMRFKITYHHNSIFNIVETYEKVLGNDRNYNGQQSFVFDLEKGTPVSLGEIYEFSDDFVKYIDNKITKEIENTKGLTTFEDNLGFSGIRKDTSFYIDEEEDKLYIFYNSLEISPERNLLPTFEFTLDELSPYLADDYKNRLD